MTSGGTGLRGCRPRPSRADELRPRPPTPPTCAIAAAKVSPLPASAALPSSPDRRWRKRRYENIACRAHDCVDAVVFRQQPNAGGAKGKSHFHRDGRGGQKFGVGPRQNRPGSAVVGPAFDDPPDPRRLIRAVRREYQPPRGFRSCRDGLREALAVAGHQADRPCDHGRRAAVVHGQIHPAQAGQLACQLQDAPDVGQPPPVDRLVAGADKDS